VANEKITDHFIASLLKLANIDFTPNTSNIIEIQKALKTASKRGTQKTGYPEFVAKIDDFIIVIENKATTDKQAIYTNEEKTVLDTSVQAKTDYAENGALHYAQHIVKETSYKQVFAFGCSGNKKHHVIRPIFVDEKSYKLLDSVENFSNFSVENIQNYYKQAVLGEEAQEVLELQEIIKKAKEIHEDLQNYGQLGTNEKPLVVSAILLALSERTFSLSNLKGDTINTDGKILFKAVSDYMERVEVSPDTKKERVLANFELIKNSTILNEKNEHLQKTPLQYFSEKIQEILPQIKANTPEDVLGRFYGEFISYSGGDGQALGIILTPKHITELFCELIDIKPNDKVFDPCCGTGGFLIAAIHHMLEKASNDQEKEQIKKERIFGTEMRHEMFSIATTNMILRGDGKSNLENKDCFTIIPKEYRKHNLSVGFINPPYSLAKNKETAHLAEINYIKHLLDCLDDKARCVAIIPQSTMVGKTKEARQVKAQLLKKHTLEGVITLNKNTFYGVGTNPCIAVFTAHQKHDKNKRVKFINFENDGYYVHKHIGLVASEHAIEKKQALLDWWFDRSDTSSNHLIKTTIEADDEWLHSFYYFNDEIPSVKSFEKTVADYLSFEFNMIMQDRQYLFEQDDESTSLNEELKKKAFSQQIVPPEDKEWKEFVIGEVFEIESGKCSNVSKLKMGDIPYVGATNRNNGVLNFVENNTNLISKGNCIVFICDGEGSVGYSIYKKENFIGSTTVKIGRNEKLNPYIGFFITSVADQVHSKYSFGFKRNTKRLKKEKILLPINTQGEIDYEYMEIYMYRLEYNKIIQYVKYITPPPEN